MKLGTKFNGSWCKIQWSEVSEMELAAKTNGAGCEDQWSRVRRPMELAANETWLGTWHIRTYRLMLTYVDPMHACSDLHVTNVAAHVTNVYC